MHERVIDARWLEPPEPMALTLDALEVLGQDEHLRLLIHREPYPLFPLLKEWGYEYRMHSCDDGTYEILIWHAGHAAPGADRASP